MAPTVLAVVIWWFHRKFNAPTTQYPCTPGPKVVAIVVKARVCIHLWYIQKDEAAVGGGWWFALGVRSRENGGDGGDGQ